MRVFLTGVSGCVGSAVSRELLARGHSVVGVDLQPPVVQHDSPNFKFIYGSILDRTFLRDAIRGSDSVIHLAAHLGVNRTEVNRLRCMDINIDGTKNVLEAAHATGSVNRFIFASSSEVYGEPIENPVTEESITQGKTIYAISKLAGEQLVTAYDKELNAFGTTILRYFNTYGVGQIGQFVISRFINKVLSNEPPIVNGLGNQLRSYCNASDTARATVMALENDVSIGKTYNIGNSNEPITILELANLIIRLSPNKHLVPNILEDSFSDRDEGREIYFRHADTSKALIELGFEADVSLERGLRQVLDAGALRPDWGTYERSYG